MKITNKTIIMQNTQTGQTFVDVNTAQKALRSAKWKGAMAMGCAMLTVKFVGVVVNGVIDSVTKGDN